MSALCAAQDNPASTPSAATPAPASPAPETREGFNPFSALRDFFNRILPAQRPGADPVTPPAPAAQPTPAAPITDPAPTPAAEPAPAAAAAPPPAAERAVAPSTAGLAPAAEPTPAPTASASEASQALAAPATPSAPPVIGLPLPSSAPAIATMRAGIALLLPIKAPAFARAAEVTRAGFMAARDAGKDTATVIVIETDGSPERARAAYREAAAKAQVVVGPLTRNEVAALMGEAMLVPTLVLNLPYTPAGGRGAAPRLPKQMRALALNIEHEALSAARAVYRPDAPNAVVVTTNSALQKRAATAFTDTWLQLGGQMSNPIEFSGSLARVRQGIERSKADVVFLAADAASARLLRPYLGRNTTVIATSQVYAGPPKSDAQKFHDMNGIRFIDMPWLHQADRAALGFAQSGTPLSPDLERLYALGIDAYRVARELMQGHSEFDLDGVTGKLHVHPGSIEREPIQAEYRDGEVGQVR